MKNAKKVLFLALCVLGISNLVLADKNKCEKTAVIAVEKEFNKYFFSHNHRIRHVDLVECKNMISKKGLAYKACEVSASNGEGAGDVTFGVFQTADCKRSFQAFIIGEE